RCKPKLRVARSPEGICNFFLRNPAKIRGLKMLTQSDHRQATRPAETPPAEHGNASLPRAVVLHKEDSNKQTLGFPPCSLAEPKRVSFFTPLYAKCVSVDGLWTTNCWALSVWDTGAQLEV